MLTTIIITCATVASPVITLAIYNLMAKKKHDERETSIRLDLARVEAKVDAIPERMNGKILRAIMEHSSSCQR